MNKEKLYKQIIEYLRRYNPKRIAVFGSYARDEETKKSDIDLLVKFGNDITLLDLVEMREHLNKILGIKVDIITENALNKNIKKFIIPDLQIIYE